MGELNIVSKNVTNNVQTLSNNFGDGISNLVAKCEKKQGYTLEKRVTYF